MGKARFVQTALILCAACSGPLAAQGPSFDTSGNGLLHGTYYFRHIIYDIATTPDSQGVTGDIDEAVASYGTVTFDGNGNYSIGNGVEVDSSSGTTTLAVSGTYSISASGYGFISSPIVRGDSIAGLVSANGVFVGSSTETSFNYVDMIIAAPLSSPLPGLSTFQGTWSVAGFLPGGSPLNTADVFFQVNPDGNGNLGTVNVTGYYGAGGTNTLTQTSPNIKYSFSNGAGVVTFPTSSTAPFFSGPEFLYFSPDGNFFFGGSPTGGFDMLVGVRNGTGTPNFGGLYYEAGLDQDESRLRSLFYAGADGYYGSFRATGAGTIVAHQRVNSILNTAAVGSTFADTFPQPATATYTDTPASVQYAVGAGGAVRIGQGIWPFLGISVALQAPTFSPAGAVYLDPTGIVNAASFTPFTAGISNGEFLTLYGTNLAGKTLVASTVPYPTTLAGVQVTINGVAAPIYYVTSGQIAVIAPFVDPFSLAQIQVNNNGVLSNTVTVPVYKTTPGVFTLSNSGLGYGAVVHVNGSVVTPANPAQPGETVEVFVSGLGIAFPPIPDGAAPPVSPLSNTVNTITAGVAGNPAVVTFAGLAPYLAGLYQVNVTIPSTAVAGDNTLDISGPDSYAAQALIRVGTGSTTSAPAAQAVTALGRPHRNPGALATRPAPCFLGGSRECPVR